MSKQKQAPISASVMDRIKGGDVKMHSRMYFILLMIASIAAILFSTMTLTYVLSIVFFWLRIQTADTMAWGARANLNELISSFPWWALMLAIAMLIITVWLVKQQGSMYKHKTTTIILAVATVSLIVGLTLSYLGLGGSHYQNRRTNDTQIHRGPGWQQNSR